MAEDKRLYGYAAAGRVLGKSRATVYSRYINGHMPEPDGYTWQDQPLWYLSTLEKHKEEYKGRNRKGGG